MKATTKITVLVLFIAIQAQAQLGISKFSIGYSQWIRAYDGSDERVFFSSAYNPAVDFTQKAGMPTVSTELRLYKGLGLEGRLGLWKYTFENEFSFGDDVIQESITQRIIPGSLNLLYNAEITPRLSFYGGAGVNRYFIQETVGRTVTPGEGTVEPTTFTGNNYGWNNQLGLEFWITNNIGLAIEGRQHFGSYRKTYIPTTDAAAVTSKIDLKGLEFGASLRYRVGSQKKSSYGKGKKGKYFPSNATYPAAGSGSASSPTTSAPAAGAPSTGSGAGVSEVQAQTAPAPVQQAAPAVATPSAQPARPTTTEPTQAAAPVAQPRQAAAPAEPKPVAIKQNSSDPIPLNQTPISNTYPVPTESQVPVIMKGAQTEFVVGSDNLGENEVVMLDETADFMKKFGQYNIIIYGHACDLGSPEVNYRLSLKRADRARTMLINKAISPSRIAIVGVGADQPKVPNSSEDNRRINRRIEVFRFIAR